MRFIASFVATFAFLWIVPTAIVLLMQWVEQSTLSMDPEAVEWRDTLRRFWFVMTVCTSFAFAAREDDF